MCGRLGALPNFLVLRREDNRTRVELLRFFREDGVPSFAQEWQGQPSDERVIFEAKVFETGESLKPERTKTEVGRNEDIGKRHDYRRFARLAFFYGPEGIPEGLRRHGQRKGFDLRLPTTHPLLVRASIQRGGNRQR